MGINDALMGGTLEMRRQGENYLPNGLMKMKTLIKNACLWLRSSCVWRKHQTKYWAHICRADVLSEETPEKIREYAENIDMEGADWMCGRSNFSVSHFSMVCTCAGGLSTNGYERDSDKSRENAAGGRPYVTMLNPRQVIGGNRKLKKGKLFSLICV